MILAIDYDGTIGEDGYFPEVAPIKEGCIEALNKLKADGHQLILWTCREGESLEKAVEDLAVKGITFDAVNANINPSPNFNPRKVFAHYYLDDHSFEGLFRRPDAWTKFIEMIN